MEITHQNEDCIAVLLNDYDELAERVARDSEWKEFEPGETFIGEVKILHDRIIFTAFSVRIDFEELKMPEDINWRDYSMLYLKKERKRCDFSDLLLMNETIKRILNGTSYEAIKELSANYV